MSFVLMALCPVRPFSKDQGVAALIDKLSYQYAAGVRRLPNPRHKKEQKTNKAGRVARPGSGSRKRFVP
ncbi:hypothetical protein GCM10009104_02800 [Marinobacterium maritimum]|uniref:Uncharacterized protein n=1 Tax=Marinobacterium maritimum TaxID=500162 RepID=A0ABP3T565_9GAMM